MSPSHPRWPGSRTYRAFMSGLAFVALVSCQHRSSVSGQPPAPDRAKVGYGEQPREQVGGTGQAVNDSEFRDRRAPQVEQLLEGRVPGVNVVRTRSGGYVFRIRGASTLVGRQGPLYVVDGIPVEIDPEHGLDWLSPTEIERVEVLKTAAETSMYGVRGANGVILITTKRAR
jgi:TonB-dependent SusC/RagA subfamily outer membrane receptor